MSAVSPVVLGLVLALPPEGPEREQVLAALAARPELRLGAPQGHLLPFTTEAADPMELHRWLEALPGVAAVDVAFVEVADSAGDDLSPLSAHAP
jgi:hypothetical protein